MNTLKSLYEELQLRVEIAMPVIKAAERISNKVIIGNTKISYEAYKKMISEFEVILNSAYEEKIQNMQYDFIPIAVINNNKFVNNIQICLNEIRREQFF